MTQAGSVRACNRLEDMVTMDSLSKLALFQTNVLNILLDLDIVWCASDKDMVMTMLNQHC